MRCIFLPAVLLAAASPASPRTVDAAPTALQSYYRARAVLDAGVAAIGGEAALRGLTGVERAMAFRYIDAGQQQHLPTASVDRLAVSVRSDITTKVDYAGSRFARIERFDDGPGDWFLHRDAGDASGGFEAGVFRDEKPFYGVHSAADFATLRERELRSYPEALLRDALARAETLQWVGATVASARTLDVVSFVDAQGQRQLLSFDAITHLLAKSETLRDHACSAIPMPNRLCGLSSRWSACPPVSLSHHDRWASVT